MQHEPAPRLDRAAEMHRRIGRDTGVDLKLAQQVVQPESRDRRADADAQRAFGIMRAHRDDGTCKARIADSGHGQQELTGEITGAIHRHDP
ncbi:hypothetical protein GCM10011395_07350 [Sphingomonas psychrolutea]|uniref:Uncharacterized protein n=1 Tax=Sphingomonas psychrolutea TaxID=1259676 RepID=A0ABQ1GA37_9SPHN|nr:hypothetical protein GCM10011395_07350 [Sphingomonas psychrolutea]